MTVEIGLGVQSDKLPEDYRRIAAIAEDGGVDVLSVYSDLMFQPPLPALLEMARVTSRVRLGAACWNPYTLHPYEIAGQLAALDRASQGRAYLGLARGSWLRAIGVAQPRPVDRLREAIEVIHRLLRGDRDGFDGDIFRLEPRVSLNYAPLRAAPPLLIGTWGARTAALAGRVANELKIGGSVNPAMVAVLRGRIAVGAADIGRPVDEVRIVIGAVTVVDLDAAAARARARAEVALYLPVVAALDPTLDVAVDVVDRIAGLVAAGDAVAAGALIGDDLLDMFAFAGAPDEVAAQAQRLIDAGAGRIEFGTPHGLHDDDGVRLICEHVLPQLRRQSPAPRQGAAAYTDDGTSHD